jgi:hypothetical protein
VVAGVARLPYTVRAAVGLADRLPYSITAPVAKTLTQPWSIRHAVGLALQQPWSVGQGVGAHLRMDYLVASGVTVGGDLSLPYVVQNVAARPMTFDWRILLGDTPDDTWTVTEPVGTAGGTFTITVDGQTTGPLAWDATAATVAAAVAALSSVGAGNVLVYGSDGIYYVLELVGALAGTPHTVSADFSSLTGGTGGGTDHTVTGGATAARPQAPRYRVRVAWGSDPLSSSPIWADVSKDFLGATITRGRQENLDRFESGKMTLRLLDRQGDYDPTNDLSPWAGELVPMKRVRLEANYNGLGWECLYDGHIEIIAPKRTSPKGQVTTIECSDAFAIWEASQMEPGSAFFAVQHVDARIRAMSALVGWPAERTSIYSGNVDVQEINYGTGGSHLEGAQDAADAEFAGVGVLFTSKEGIVKFRGRAARFEQLHVAILGDAGAIVDFPYPENNVLPIRDVTPVLDVEKIINHATVYPAGVDNLATLQRQVVKNAASITKYGQRPLELSDLLIYRGTLTGNDALDEAKMVGQFYVDNFHEPEVRAGQVVITHGMATGYPTALYWKFLLALELGQVVALYTRNPGGGGINGDTYFVEGYETVIENEGEGGSHAAYTTTLDLSPASLWGTGEALGLG